MTGVVRVYRNLKHGRAAPPLYSIQRKGKVVDWRRAVLLTGARFVVSEAGRQRVLKTGRKNVHAYVEGRLVDGFGAFGIDADSPKDLPARITYNPKLGPSFMWEGTAVKGARVVLLNRHGMSAAYVEVQR